MASTYDFTVTQGSEFEVRLLLKDDADNPINLPGYGVRGSVKHRYSDATAKLDLSPAIVTGSDGRYFSWIQSAGGGEIYTWSELGDYPLDWYDTYGVSYTPYIYAVGVTNPSGFAYPHIDIKLTAAQTSALPVMQGVYDIELYSGTYANKPIKGLFNVLPEVTA